MYKERNRRVLEFAFENLTPNRAVNKRAVNIRTEDAAMSAGQSPRRRVDVIMKALKTSKTAEYAPQQRDIVTIYKYDIGTNART